MSSQPARTPSSLSLSLSKEMAAQTQAAHALSTGSRRFESIFLMELHGRILGGSVSRQAHRKRGIANPLAMSRLALTKCLCQGVLAKVCLCFSLCACCMEKYSTQETQRNKLGELARAAEERMKEKHQKTQLSPTTSLSGRRTCIYIYIHIYIVLAQSQGLGLMWKQTNLYRHNFSFGKWSIDKNTVAWQNHLDLTDSTRSNRLTSSPASPRPFCRCSITRTRPHSSSRPSRLAAHRT